MRLALALLLTGCSATVAPVTAPEVKRDVPTKSHRTFPPSPERLRAHVFRVSRSAHRRPVAHHTPQSVAPVVALHEWSGVAACESSGNWSANTGNGYYGGLQMDLAFWANYGGTDYAARPDLASEQHQITVAERGLAVQGAGAWPVCGRSLR